jgi:hypothetical protein
VSVTHATVASDPQTPRLGDTDWNAAHLVLLDAGDVGADPAGSAAAAQSAAETYADGILNTATVRTAAGVPAGPPVGTELPIAFDTTPSSGGIYLWNGAAWVQAAPIPPVVIPS